MTTLSCRGHPDFRAGPMPGVRFYREFARQQPDTFVNHSWPFAAGLQFRVRHGSRERKSFAVVLNRELEISRALRQAHQHVMSATMLAHVDEALLHNAGQFAASLLCQIDTLELADKFRRDACL